MPERKRWLPVTGAVLARIRRDRKKSQPQAAKYAGVTTGTITRLEKGQIASPDPVMLWKLTDFYEQPFGAFVVLIDAERQARTEKQPFTLADADGLAKTIADGPSPAVARQALQETQGALWPILDRLDTLLNVDLAPRRQATDSRQHPTDGTPPDRNVG